MAMFGSSWNEYDYTMQDIRDAKAEARQEAFEDVIKAIETKQWHPGNAKGAINPSSVIALIRSLK